MGTSGRSVPWRSGSTCRKFRDSALYGLYRQTMSHGVFATNDVTFQTDDYSDDSTNNDWTDGDTDDVTSDEAVRHGGTRYDQETIDAFKISLDTANGTQYPTTQSLKTTSEHSDDLRSGTFSSLMVQVDMAGHSVVNQSQRDDGSSIARDLIRLHFARRHQI